MSDSRCTKPMKKERAIELLQIERACIERNQAQMCDRRCERCDLCQDTDELLLMYDVVITNIKRAYGD